MASSLASPSGVAVDLSGNLFVADGHNHRVIRIDPSGVVSTVAGTGSPGYDGDGGPADKHALNYPSDVAVDSSGNIYIADTRSNWIRHVAASGTISTLAGAGRHELGGDGGPAVQGALNRPSDVAVDSLGNLFIADTGNGRVRRVNPSGLISTVTSAGDDALDDEPIPLDPFWEIPDVAVDASGNLYFANDLLHRIWRIDRSGTLAKVAGTGTNGYSGDWGPATEAAIGEPRGLVVDSSGRLYFCDTEFHVVRRIDPSGTIATVAGTGASGFGGDGGPAVEAELATPQAVAVDAAGNLYIADTRNFRIRRVDPSGTITTAVGTGESGGFREAQDDSSMHRVPFGSPESVAVDPTGNVYALLGSRGSVLRIDPSGTITVLAEAAVSVTSRGNGLAVDPAGSVYIADTRKDRVVRIDKSGAITTVAGSPTE